MRWPVEAVAAPGRRAGAVAGGSERADVADGRGPQRRGADERDAGTASVGRPARLPAGAPERPAAGKLTASIGGLLTWPSAGRECAWYGRELLVVDRWFPSGKLCRACGTVREKLPLNVRAWTCDCGVTPDRDVNAARGILAAGPAASACGDGVRPQRESSRTGQSSVRQEPQRATAGIPRLEAWGESQQRESPCPPGHFGALHGGDSPRRAGRSPTARHHSGFIFDDAETVWEDGPFGRMRVFQ